MQQRDNQDVIAVAVLVALLVFSPARLYHCLYDAACAVTERTAIVESITDHN